MSIALTSGQKVTKSGDTLTIPYTVSGDNAGNANQVSVLVTDKAYDAEGAAIKKYGKLATDGSFAASGTGTFALPEGLTGTLGTDYHIYLLAEDVNEEKETDYANLKEITADDIGAAGPTAKENLVYNGSDQKLVEAPESSNYLYSLTGADNSFNATIPKGKNAGDYTVYYKETAEAETKNLTVTIAKKEVTVDGIAVSDKVYNGTMSAVLDYTNVTYKNGGENALVSGDTLTVMATGAFADANVGDSKSVTISDITLGGASVGNYTLAASGNQTSATGKITKKAVTVTAKAQTVEVNGTIQTGVSEAELNGAVDGHTLSAVTLTAGNVASVGSSTVTPSNATIKNGDTDVTSNYEITYTAGTLTVTKTQPKLKTGTTLTAGSLTYGQTLKDSQLTGTMVDKSNEEAEVAGTFAWKDKEITPAVSDSEKTEYDVVFTPADTDNYKAAECKVKLKVSKASITPEVSIAGWTYGETAKEPGVTGNTGNGKVTYTYAKKGATDFSEAVPSDAGEYTVKAVIAETDNYQGGEAVADFAIAKADPAVTAPVSKTLNHTGSAMKLVDAGSVTGGTMQYAIGTDDKKAPTTGWSDIIPVATDAGTCYVWYKAVGDANHTDTEAACVISKIKAEISAKVTFKVVNGTWDDGTTAEKTVTLTGYEGDTLKLAATDIPAAGTKPGDNYKAGSWDVTPKADTAITKDTTYTYTYAKEAEAPIPAVTPAKKDIIINFKSVTQKNNKVQLSWTKVSEADGYDVYLSYCESKVKKPVKTIGKNTTTTASLSRIDGKKINQKKNFHVYVAAYRMVDGKKVTIAKTVSAHLSGTESKKYTNPKAIKLTKSSYSINVGKTAKIKAKVTLVNKNKKHIPKSHGAKFRYKSSDTSIATVSKKGKIKGIKKGKCTIYVYSINGLVKKAKVTVK